MRADTDFTAYVVARWTPVVRMSVLVGLPPDRAEQAAVGAFARMLPDWGRLTHEGDLEVELAQALLVEWARAGTAQAAPRPVLVPPAPFVTSDLEEQLALLERLSEGLAALDQSTRTTLLLHYFGELDIGQLTEALAESPVDVHARLAAGAATIALGPLEPVCRSVASAIPVGPASVERVVGRARAGRRRQWLVTALVLLVLVTAGGVAYLVNRPDEPDRSTPLGPLEIAAAENPVDLAWWSVGVLHLVHGTAPLDDVHQLVEAGSGVVYADTTGDVISVSDSGSRARLGRKDSTTPLAASGSLGLVSWVDAGSGDLVVYDVLTQVEAGRLQTQGAAEPIAFDQGRLYYRDDGRDWSWSMEDPPSLRTSEVDLTDGNSSGQPSLVDVSSATQLRLDTGQLSTVQPFFSVSWFLPGYDGRLSPDGNFALAAMAGGDAPPVVYDTRSGQPQDSWFASDWRPVTASFNHDGRVVWVVDEGDGRLMIFSCTPTHAFVNSFEPDSEPCTAGAGIGKDVPLLAGRLSR